MHFVARLSRSDLSEISGAVGKELNYDPLTKGLITRRSPGCQPWPGRRDQPPLLPERGAGNGPSIKDMVRRPRGLDAHAIGTFGADGRYRLMEQMDAIDLYSGPPLKPPQPGTKRVSTTWPFGALGTPSHVGRRVSGTSPSPAAIDLLGVP